MEVSKKQEVLSGEATVSPDTKSITVNIVEPISKLIIILTDI